MALKLSALPNSYVKFVRTTPDKWALLTSRDSDTLYFVVAAGAKEGSLYLGDALIATSIDEGLRLEDLLDIEYPTALAEDEVLIWNGSAWVNKDIYSFMPVTMTGASETGDGLGGLVPVPVKGDQKLFLRGDATWADPTAELTVTVGNLSKTLEEAVNNIDTIIGTDTGSTMRAVATEVTNAAITALVNDAPEAFNTLKEIADWITGDHEGGVDAADLITDVANMKEILNHETTGLVKRVGDLETSLGSLDEYVGELSDVIGNENYGLVKQVNDNTTAIGENAGEITKLWEALTWNILVDE